ELDRSGAPENRNLDLELLLLGFDLFDRAREIGECAVDDANLVALFEGEARLGFDGALDNAFAKLFDLGRLHFLRRLVADEAGDLGRVLDEVPNRLAHLHLDEDVTGEAVLLANA